MIPWECLDKRESGLSLWQRGSEYVIRTGSSELMNSRRHGSEEALAELAIARVQNQAPRILIGGLGIGYTLRAALDRLSPAAEIVVAELFAEVIDWNRRWLGPLCRRPLDDPRTTLIQTDVADVVRAPGSTFDAILLDVDNGPQGLTRPENDRLYAPAGLQTLRQALRPGGILAVWSNGPDERFTRRLQQCGFAVEIKSVAARGAGGGRLHTIWLARRT